MKTFQKPLSKEEESLCIQALQAEDAGRKSEAKRLLIERNLRLVAHIAKKYSSEEELEDLISIGTIGLIKAVETFDPQKNSRLAAYAARCIDNELLMMLRSKKKTSREVSLYEPIGTDREGNEINLLDVMEQKQPDIVEEMEKQRLNQKLYELMESVLSGKRRCCIFGMDCPEERNLRRKRWENGWEFPEAMSAGLKNERSCAYGMRRGDERLIFEKQQCKKQ